MPLGFLCAALFLLFAQPRPATLLAGAVVSLFGLSLRAWAAGHIRKNDDLREQIGILQKKVETLENPDSKLIFKDDAYYDSKGDGPFCTGCHDSTRKKIRLTNHPYAKKALGKYGCPICNANYGRYQKSNAGI